MEPIGDSVKIMRRAEPEKKKKKKIDPEMSLHTTCKHTRWMDGRLKKKKFIF